MIFMTSIDFDEFSFVVDNIKDEIGLVVFPASIVQSMCRSSIQVRESIDSKSMSYLPYMSQNRLAGNATNGPGNHRGRERDQRAGNATNGPGTDPHSALPRQRLVGLCVARPVGVVTQRIFVLQHRECVCCNTENVCVGTQRMFVLQHRE